MRFIIVFFALTLSVAAQTTQPPAIELPAEAPESLAPPTFPALPMTMTTPLGKFPMFVELAVTPESRQWGLMFRPDLPDDYGMLFVMPQEGILSFWMRNTLSPLDIIYINSENVVVSIARGEPLNETPLPSAAPAKFVFEVRQGLAEVYGIEPGTTLLFQ